MGEPAMNQENKPAGHGGGAYVDVDMGHDYDGIREFDNRLPQWWLLTLWGAVVFAIGYWGYYHTTQTGALSMQAYNAEVDEAKKLEAERAAKAGVVTDDTLLTMSKDTAAVERGKKAYVTNCVACHKADGGGLVGPNLTDAYWVHGEKPTELLKVVSEGVLAKGMPAWKPVLGPTTTQEVVAYLLTLKDTNAAGGKAAEGKNAAGELAPGEAAVAPAPAPSPDAPAPDAPAPDASPTDAPPTEAG